MKRVILVLTAAVTIIANSYAVEFSGVVNPTIPQRYVFAGDTLDLDNYDSFERLDRELTAMAYTHGNTLLQIKRANRYFPMLKPILERNGVPTDMIYLACIESQMNPTAVSPAKAAGLWQFMPATAREYGLIVDDYVDQRYDPELATEAACKYLKSAYRKYGKWESVAASYNAGMGRISREQETQGVTSAYNMWLPEETMRYVYRLVAAKIIMENPQQFGYRLRKDQLYQPIEYDVVEVSEPVDSWAQWAKNHGTDYYTVRRHNPWIRNTSLPNREGRTFKVKIPKAESSRRSSTTATSYNPYWVVD